jgi:hypothetical protein
MPVCPVGPDGWCPRHRTRHVGHLLELALMDNEHGEAYRRLWDSGAIVPGGPRAEPCRHRGAVLGEEPCPSCRGHVRVKAFACALHQACTVGQMVAGRACCATCPDYALPDTAPDATAAANHP